MEVQLFNNPFLPSNCKNTFFEARVTGSKSPELRVIPRRSVAWHQLPPHTYDPSYTAAGTSRRGGENHVWHFLRRGAWQRIGPQRKRVSGHFFYMWMLPSGARRSQWMLPRPTSKKRKEETIRDAYI